MGSEERDKLLLEFLESERTNRKQHGVTLTTLLDEVREGRREITLLRNENAVLRTQVGELTVKIATVHHLTFEIAKDRLIDRDRIVRQGKRLDHLEQQVALMSTSTAMRSIPDWEPDPMLRTGVHNLVEIQRAQKELEERVQAAEDQKFQEQQRKVESGIWWARKKREVLLTIAAGVFVATCVGCAGYVAKPIIEKVLVPAFAPGNHH